MKLTVTITHLRLSLLPVSILILLAICPSCKNYEFNSPVDPWVDPKVPAIDSVTFLADTAAVVKWNDVGREYEEHYPKLVKVYEIEQGESMTSFQKVDESKAPSRSKQIRYDYVLGPNGASKTYFFRMRVRYGERISWYSKVDSAVLRFNATTNVVATALADTAVRVTWQDSSNFGAIFKVEKSTDGTNYMEVASVGAHQRQVVIPMAVNVETTYTFRVRARSQLNVSEYGFCQFRLQFPAPMTVVATALADTAVRVTWQDNSNFETGFVVEKSTNGMTYMEVANVGANHTQVVIPMAVSVETTYTFRVRAHSQYNQSAYAVSSPMTLTLTEPSHLRITSIGTTDLGLQWDYSSGFEAGFEIESSGDGINYHSAGTVGVGITGMVLSITYDTTQSYYFRVRARSRHNISEYSNRVRVYYKELYVGGWFTAAGGVSAPYIAKWNGSSWSAVGGMSDGVSALTVYNNEMYAGGSFTTAGGVSTPYIAKWNGSNWSAVGSGMNTNAYALAVYDNELYAGGSFTTAGGVSTPYIAKWNASGWSAVGSGMNDWVSTLAVYNNELYAGGSFTTAGGVSAPYIAKWNGSNWSAVVSGMNTNVYALAVYDNELYAGGSFTTAGGVSTPYIAKWNGSSWSAVGSGMGDHVITLAVYDNELYAGGSFTTAGGVSAPHIAKWNGSSWSAVGSGMDGWVSALALYNNELYAGGDFTTAGGVSARNIAKWNGSHWSAVGSGTAYHVSAFVVYGQWAWESLP